MTSLNFMTLRLVLPLSAVFLSGAALPQRPSNPCAYWIGQYDGRISDDQSLAGGEQRIVVVVNRRNVTVAIRGNGTPSIDISSENHICSKSILRANFRDNFDTRGVITMNRSYRINFSNIVEGSRVNNSGFYPVAKIALDRRK